MKNPRPGAIMLAAIVVGSFSSISGVHQGIRDAGAVASIAMLLMDHVNVNAYVSNMQMVFLENMHQCAM